MFVLLDRKLGATGVIFQLEGFAGRYVCIAPYSNLNKIQGCVHEVLSKP